MFYGDDAGSGTIKRKTDAMELKFDYREINNSYQNVPVKVTYENDFGEKPPRLNGDPDDDLTRNAFISVGSNNICGYATIDDTWAELMSHHTVEVDENGQPTSYVNE